MKISQEAKDRAANYMFRKRKPPLAEKATEIASGYKNLLKSKLGLSSEEDEKVFEARREVCDACVHKTALDRCSLCGCPLAAKIRSETSECPVKLW